MIDPHGSLKLAVILQGVMDFAREYKGTLVTETMLVHGFNDDKTHIKEIADCISRIQPEKAYLLIPTRPPAETNVTKPTEESLRNAYDIFRQNGLEVECIAADEGDNFYFSDDFVNDLLSITAVHPVKEDVVFDLLKRRSLDESVIDQLVSKQMISSYEYEGKRFYKRNL